LFPRVSSSGKLLAPFLGRASFRLTVNGLELQRWGKGTGELGNGKGWLHIGDCVLRTAYCELLFGFVLTRILPRLFSQKFTHDGVAGVDRDSFDRRHCMKAAVKDLSQKHLLRDVFIRPQTSTERATSHSI